jgi:hypothetical protein
MHFRVTAAVGLLVLFVAPHARAQQSRPAFTVQVASFPEYSIAERFAARIAATGERISLLTVALSGRGNWTRVLVGSFATAEKARTHGNSLVSKGLVREFIVARIDGADHAQIQTIEESRPRSALAPVVHTSFSRLSPERASLSSLSASRAARPLPLASSRVLLKLVSVGDPARAPYANSVQAAIGFVLGVRTWRPDSRQSGLWLSGNVLGGRERLEWIAGSANEGAVLVGPDGRVTLSWALLMKAAGIRDAGRADAALVLANYIAMDEGLLLLVQLTEGTHRYGLHVAPQAPTQGGPIPVRAGVNLDTNFDSRINPYRRTGRKLDTELPPSGFDALIGLNPDARWLNLGANMLVPAGNIAFHELAEAQAKVALGLDYLSQGSQPGAHDLAIEREWRLKAQRPERRVVVTAGPNRVLGSLEEERVESSSSMGGAKHK